MSTPPAGMPLSYYEGAKKPKKAKAIKWKVHADSATGLYPKGAIVTAVVETRFRDAYDQNRTSEIALRLDGRGAGRPSWRVDMKPSSMEPWEAIDGGDPFTSRSEAKKFAEAWHRSSLAQQTLSPRNVPRTPKKSPKRDTKYSITMAELDAGMDREAARLDALSPKRNAMQRRYTVRYVHKISPRPGDVGPDVWLPVPVDMKTLAKLLREQKVLASGERLSQNSRIERDERVIAFPVASVWHSIILTPTADTREGTMARKTKTVKSAKTDKVCLMSGYAYELDPEGGSWDKAKDDSWEIVMQDGGPATVLGKRSIDGSECVVAKKGSKIYAQTALSVKKC